jgi:chromosome segregation ATPase
MENPAEVQELRNKLRMMKSPQAEILNCVRKQQRAIYKQKKANETLRNEISQYEFQIEEMNKLLEEHKTNEELQRLQQQQKTLHGKLSIMGADLSAETTKQKKLEEEVSREHSHSGGLFKQLRENEELQARLRTMENRLDKALLRYNKNLERLVEFRAEIDELRKDRNNFRGVLKTAETDREHKDQEIGELIATSNEAYATRDRQKMKLVRLKNAEKQDVRAFEERLSVLDAQIEGRKLTQGHSVDAQPSQRSMDGTAGTQSDQQEELQSLTDQYQATIQALLDMSGMKDVSDLFAEAGRLERENFSLYTYVVEHAAVKTKLLDDIDGLDLQRETLLAQIAETDEDQGSVLEKLTAEIQSIDTDLEHIGEEKEHNEGEFASVYVQIEKIVDLLGCPWESAPDGKSTTTRMNALYCLSLVETAIAGKINTIYEKTKQECTFKDIKSTSFLPEERIDLSVARFPTQSRLVTDRELAAKVGDSSKPLLLEELRAMLE